jgi:hypothetical protein
MGHLESLNDRIFQIKEKKIKKKNVGKIDKKNVINIEKAGA